MIYVDQPVLWIPAEGQRSMLNLAKVGFCQGCPAGIGAGDPAAAPPDFDLYAVLYQNNVPVVPTTVQGDLGLVIGYPSLAPIQLNGATPPDYCDDYIEGPALGMDDLWRLVMDQVIWTVGGGISLALYGLALIVVPSGGSVTDGWILAFGPFTTSPIAIEAGDSIKLTAEIVPCLCLPPAVPEVPEP